MKKRICIGIPCFSSVSPETLEDYMRFAFYLGRHYQDYDFFLAIKSKSEQFRARNSIVEAALQAGADYVLMLDDDHVIDWAETPSLEPNKEQSHYEFLRKLVGHLQNTPKAGIVGALYFHRGGDCRAVIMKEGKDGGFYYMRDDEIQNGLQEVAVTGGGCMLIDMNVFSRIPQPWFDAEHKFGTDIQICSQARKEGFGVYCDTSIVVGHVLSRREVVTPKNRHRIMANSYEKGNGGIDSNWSGNAALQLYQMDVEEYLGCSLQEAQAIEYDMDDLQKHIEAGTLEEYYRKKGKEQLARQAIFHSTLPMREEMEFIHAAINTNTEAYGLEFGCGSAPVSFELALRGHKLDFVDIDGAGAYEFTKWRAKKRNVNCGFTLAGPYDYVMLLDCIEHIADWQSMLENVLGRLKDNGALVTNYFRNNDYANPEHISMDKAAVRKFLVEHGIYPVNEMIWVKRDLGFMDREVA